MNLGEKIYALRNEKNLSQGALADMLGVSRQSVSKWENNSAVPDLDKIVELSEIFGVSLDELVKGKSVSANTKDNNFEQNGINKNQVDLTQYESNTSNNNKQIIYVTQKREGRKTAGVVLLCMAFAVLLFFTLMGDFLTGFVFQSPFLICGIICLTVKKYTGIVCAWVMGLLLDAYIRWGTGLNFRTVLWTFQWTQEMNFTRLGIAWVQVFAILTITIITIVRIGKGTIANTARNRNLLIAGYGVLVVVIIAIQLLLYMIFALDIVWFINKFRLFSLIVYSFLDWIQLLGIAILCAYTIRYFKGKKLEK